MIDGKLERELQSLGSAEEFFDYFELEYDASVVQVNRLHILQRFHNYIADHGALPEDEAERETRYGQLLQRAYRDFLHSTPQEEKVFKVFRMGQPQQVSISLEELLSGGHGAAKI